MLNPPIQKYLAVLELELKRHAGVSPEEALSDAREYLQNQQNSLLRAEPGLDDDALYARFVESFGPPQEVAASYAESSADDGETPAAFAPGWRICCTECGRSAPFDKYGIRIGAVSLHKYTLGYCRGCRWIRWLRIIQDSDRANLTERLGFDNTPDEVRRSLHRPWLVLSTILAVVLLAQLVQWLFVETAPGDAGMKSPPSPEAPIDHAAEVQVAKGDSVDSAHSAAMVVREWLNLVLAGKLEEADKLTDFPRRADATHDVRNQKLLTGIKLDRQFTHDQAVLLLSDRKRFDGMTGYLVFLAFKSPGNRFGWIVREADFVDPQELSERVNAFTAPVLLNQEVERTLGKDGNYVLDLESGRAIDLPHDWDRQVNDALKWIAVRGFDVKVFANPNKAEEVAGLALLGNVAEVREEAWSADAQELEKLLAGKQGMNSTLRPDPEHLPATYAFRTHGLPANEPYIGVLQILEIDQPRQGIRFRYRLVGKSEAVNR